MRLDVDRIRPGPVIYVSYLPPTSDSPHQSMAAAWLADRLGREQVVVVAPQRNANSSPSPLENLVHWPLARRPGTFPYYLSQFLAVLQLRWRLRRQRPLFYVHGSTSCLAACFALVGLARQRLIYHTQDFLEPGRHRLWEFFERRIARRACHVICNEPNRARFMASHYGLGRKPSVVPSYLPASWPRLHDPQYDRQRLLDRLPTPVPAGAKLLIAGGAFSEVRAGRALLQAHAQLSGEYLLAYTGVRDADRERERLRTLGMTAEQEDRMLFLPRLNDAALQTVYAAGDVGVLLYADDGVGNYYQCPGRLTQYLRAGLPIVTSRFVGLELLTLKWDLGVAVDPCSVEEIGAAIEQLCAAPAAEREERRRRLQNLAETTLCYDASAHVVTDAVERALATGGGPACVPSPATS